MRYWTTIDYQLDIRWNKNSSKSILTWADIEQTSPHIAEAVLRRAQPAFKVFRDHLNYYWVLIRRFVSLLRGNMDVCHDVSGVDGVIDEAPYSTAFLSDTYTRPQTPITSELSA